MKITIGHLFYDLLNLYGECGNVIALKNALESQNIEVEIKNLSLHNGPWNLDDLDFIYIGAGTESNIELALSTLLNQKEELNQHIINNKFILATGNSIELFGKSIELQNSKIDALSLLDYDVKRTSKRIVAECVFNLDTQDKILGFENHQSVVLGINTPLFNVEKGFGSCENSKVEGFKEKNFIGTYLLGPILVRNPKLLEGLCKDIITSKDPNFEFKNFELELEEKAHNKFLEKYSKG